MLSESMDNAKSIFGILGCKFSMVEKYLLHFCFDIWFGYGIVFIFKDSKKLLFWDHFSLLIISSLRQYKESEVFDLNKYMKLWYC